MRNETEFNKIYRQLNAKQKEAVDTIDGPVMVVAGPGTGKTTVLTLRIANIMRKTDTPPDAILALTFTESGVHAMREKLSRLIGPAAYQVKIHTFHSFSNDTIKTYPDRFQRIIGAEHMEEIEQLRIIREILDSLKLKILRPKNDPSYYIKPVISAIKELKRENISPEKLLILIKNRTAANLDSSPNLPPGKLAEEKRNLQKNKELAKVYAAYEKVLAKKRLYDFEDMIMETIKILGRDKDLLLRLQEEYHYILADEHQDANNAQNRLLELLAGFHENPNIFIVGDEKQAIFRFQGASLENFLYFRRLYPKARMIALEESYRSHQKILDAAHSLISQNKIIGGETNFPLRSAVSFAPRRVLILEAADEISELGFVAEEIKRRIKSGAAPGKIAVLVRENKNTDPIERALRAAGMPVAKFSNADALSHVRIDAFLKFLEAAIAPTDEKLAPILFFDFLRLEPHEVFVLLENARTGRRAILFEMRRAGFSGLAAKLARFASIARNEPLVSGWNQIAEESGYFSHLVSLKENRELLPLYESLLRAVERFAERNKPALVKDFLEYLVEAREHGLSLSAEAGVPDGVAIMTAHRAKGLEFDSVFILHANDGVWGGKRNRQIFNLPLPDGEEGHETEDERRLFYVALTRAKKEVTVSYHLRGGDGRERIPSRFLEEIHENHRTKEKVSSKSFHKKIPAPPRLLTDKKYLRALFLERGLSVTHLNNFLKCPWRYFFVDLIRIPQSQSPALLYGSAIHAALKIYFDAYRREETLSIKKTLEFFKGTLRRTHLSEREFQTHLKEGERELKGFLSHWNFPRTIWNEYKIAGVPLGISADRQILLNGKLDKVELLPDGSVNVVDYKTGRPKSRADIEGKTKGSEGDYKRQLVFYRLLLDGVGKWRMKTGAIDFIKPDNSGRYHREIFEITDLEVAALKKLITDVSKQIFSLSFWDKICDEKDCKFCRLRELLTQTK